MKFSHTSVTGKGGYTGPAREARGMGLRVMNFRDWWLLVGRIRLLPQES